MSPPLRLAVTRRSRFDLQSDAGLHAPCILLTWFGLLMVSWTKDG